MPPVLGAAAPAWVAVSNADAQGMLKIISKYSPEEAANFGMTGFDAEVSDLGPKRAERLTADFTAERTPLKALLQKETDPQVREDLQIMIHACDLRIEGATLEERLLVSFVDVGQMVFRGEFGLLQDQVAPGRRPAALERLKKYTGTEPGTTSAFALSKAMLEESIKDPKKLWPFKGEVDKALSGAATYSDGIRKLYAKYGIQGGAAALDAFDAQLKDYSAWITSAVLPHARRDFRLPQELYVHNLKNIGLGISPMDLIHRAQLEFTETQNELKAMAPLVAKARGFAETDYPTVIRDLKKEQLAPSEVEPYYREVIAKIQEGIKRERIVALPDRPLVMRVASAAETAANPSPHYQPPRLINNTGEQGQFVLPLGNGDAGGDAKAKYDDFAFKAAAWTLSAHEGRPGHDLQFSSMVEGGVSLARSIFAFNSVNVEGWALYSESEYKPYEPLDGQLIVLQLRLLRAARAILDPMLNLGLITREAAHDILIRDVVLSEAFATEELDRFTFRSPGQATAYFYGYSRIMELRAAAEFGLGPKFDRFAFNNFVISQGLLPPELLASAIQTKFVPSQK
jgi:hypothetical protein